MDMSKQHRILYLLCAAAASGALAQTPTTLVNFTGGDGLYPVGPLVQGLDGNLYGITSQGGTYSQGTVFRMTPAGSLTTIYNFDGLGDGGNPAGLLLDTDGYF